MTAPALRLPAPPPEVPRVSSLDLCAPRFAESVRLVLAEMRARGWAVRVFETLRTAERQRYLYGFGREYTDGRGIVTQAATAEHGWHFYGLAADIVQDDATPWHAPKAFWNDLGTITEAHRLRWGGRWKMVDLPHVQWGACRVSPSAHARALYQQGGPAAVWRAVGAA